MPVVERNTTEIILKSPPYLPQGRKRRVSDQMVVTYCPQTGDYEIQIFENDGSGRSATMVVLPEDLIAFGQALVDEVQDRP